METDTLFETVHSHLNVVHLSFKECRPHLDAEVSLITNDVLHLNAD